MSVSAQEVPKKTASRDELVITHRPLVKRIANHLAARMPASVQIDDLVQSGMIGLLEAAGKIRRQQGS